MDDISISGRRRVRLQNCFVFAAIFAAAVAVSRFLDIKSASWASDVMVGDGAAGGAAIASVVLSVAAVAFSAGALIYSAVYGGRAKALIAALLFSALVVADRSFYTVYCVVTNVKSFSQDAGSDAYIRVASDAATLVASYFITAFAASRKSDPEKSGAPQTKRASSLLFAAVLTLGETAYQTYYTVRFFGMYDDVTSIEKSSIAADYLFILLKYGVIMFGGALFFTYLIEKIGKRRKNSAETDDKNEKT